MRKLYIPTLDFFEHIKKHKSRLYTFSPVGGVSSTYQICYQYHDDLYCIIVNDADMMHFMIKRASEMMRDEDTKIEERPKKKTPRKRKNIISVEGS